MILAVGTVVALTALGIIGMMAHVLITELFFENRRGPKWLKAIGNVAMCATFVGVSCGLLGWAAAMIVTIGALK